MTEKSFTHMDEDGRINMVDISEKDISYRQARAKGKIKMKRETLSRIENMEIDKGPVLETARLAGIMAAKKTAEAVPLCHQIPLSGVELDFEINKPDSIEIECSVRTSARTGVEMEALHGVSLAALTVYDMCKAVDREMEIKDIRLMEKTGGESGEFIRTDREKKGEVVAVCMSQEKGTRKKPVPEIELAVDHGIKGDAHAGDWHRQISLLAEESILLMKDELDGDDLALGFGDFAENIATRGIKLHELKPGRRIKIGEEVLLEITQIGKECHSGCEIARKTGSCIMPEQGVFASVIAGGKVRPGDDLYFKE